MEPLVCGALDRVRVRLAGPAQSAPSSQAFTAPTGAVHAAVTSDLKFLFAVVARYAHPFRLDGGGASSAVGPTQGYTMDAGVTRAVVEALAAAGTVTERVCVQGLGGGGG